MAYRQIIGYSGHMSGKQSVIDQIVFHSTVSPCVPGGALNNARWFQNPNSGGLAHYVVDPVEVIQCCPDDVICWHAPPNPRKIGIELCDWSQGDPNRWNDYAHKRMLKLARMLGHELAHTHNVPLVYVDAAGLRVNKRGFTTHYEVSQAFHQSDHTDPGPGFAPTMKYLLSTDAVAVVSPKVHNPYIEGTTAWIQWATGAVADSIRGPKTEDAIKNFQRRHGLVADGIVGPITTAAMRQVVR